VSRGSLEGDSSSGVPGPSGGTEREQWRKGYLASLRTGLRDAGSGQASWGRSATETTSPSPFLPSSRALPRSRRGQCDLGRSLGAGRTSRASVGKRVGGLIGRAAASRPVPLGRRRLCAISRWRDTSSALGSRTSRCCEQWSRGAVDAVLREEEQVGLQPTASACADDRRRRAHRELPAMPHGSSCSARRRAGSTRGGG
jgi:hypothetical protein